MIGTRGQASAEYAGLLAIAALIGAALTLIAGPSLSRVVRDALTAALSTALPRQVLPAPRVPASPADIADVQAALAGGPEAMTPDFALMAIAKRHGADAANAIAGSLVVEAASASVPWLGGPRTYAPWANVGDGAFDPPADAGGDRDLELPLGPPVVTWVTDATQREALARALAHHATPFQIALDVAGVVPIGAIGAVARSTSRGITGARRLERGQRGLAAVSAEAGASGLFNVAGGGVPAGLRVGDISVEWPVRRSFVRDGAFRSAAVIEIGFGDHDPLPTPTLYHHVVILRAGDAGLEVIAEAGP
jgi:hypothetical protein